MNNHYNVEHTAHRFESRPVSPPARLGSHQHSQTTARPGFDRAAVAWTTWRTVFHARKSSLQRPSWRKSIAPPASIAVGSLQNFGFGSAAALCPPASDAERSEERL